MRVRFFAVPVHDSAAVQTELDRFLASHRVIDFDRQLITDGMRSTWAVCVTYVDSPAATPTRALAEVKTGKKTVDYRDVLSAEDFAVFARLRELRKAIAERDGMPAYAVFTNEHLAAMVTARARTATDLGRIPGVGQARVDKHGATFLAALRGIRRDLASPRHQARADPAQRSRRVVPRVPCAARGVETVPTTAAAVFAGAAAARACLRRGADRRTCPTDGLHRGASHHRSCPRGCVAWRRATTSAAARRVSPKPATMPDGAGHTGENRVIRGGSWNEHARNVRAAYRNANHPGNRNQNLGLRLARAQMRSRSARV